MKKLLILLILACTISVQAQNWKRGLAVVGYHTATIAIGAIGDAQYDLGNKEWGHVLKAAEVGALISGPFIFHIHRSEALSYILSYGFLRFSFFDGFYNAAAGLPMFYNGSTSTYDKVMSTMPDHGKAWVKSCSLVVGFAIPIKSF